MATKFALDPERDAWDRQPGERAEHHDWFVHWLNDRSRRSYTRTAGRFDVTSAKVRGIAERNLWQQRRRAWEAENSAQVKSRFDELIEQLLVPYAQGLAKLAAWSVQAPTEGVAPDRASAAVTNGLRLVREPSVQDLIRIAEAGSPGQQPGDVPEQPGLTHTIMAALDQFPEARQAAIEAVRQARDQHDGEAG